ncbi:hypothetical protein EON65_55050, partial [archaeon]
MSIDGVNNRLLVGLQRTADFAIRLEDSPCKILHGLAGITIRAMSCYSYVRSTGEIFNISLCQECLPRPVLYPYSSTNSSSSSCQPTFYNPSPLPFAILTRDELGNGSFSLSSMKYFEVSFHTPLCSSNHHIPHHHTTTSNIASAPVQLTIGLTSLYVNEPPSLIVYDSTGSVRASRDGGECVRFGPGDIVGCGV